MGKRQQKKGNEWSILGGGVMLSVVVYLVGVLLLALLLVKGAAGAEREAPLLAVWAMVSAACGSVPVLRIKGRSPLGICLLQGLLFGGVLLAAGFLIWDGLDWSRESFALLLSVLVGSMIPGVIKSGRRGKKGRW